MFVDQYLVVFLKRQVHGVNWCPHSDEKDLWHGAVVPFE